MAKNSFLTIAALTASVVLMSGCEWTSSGDAGGWSDSYDDMNFSGTYRTAAVATEVDDTATSTQTITSQVKMHKIGTMSSQSGSFSLGNTSIVAGSVVVNVAAADGYVHAALSDNGSGVLVSSDGSSGTVSYDGGTISITLSVAPNKWTVSASYSYTSTSSSSSSGQSNPITAITVSQNGQNLTMNCNDGTSMSGRFTNVNQLSEATGTVAATYNAQFEVSGKNSKFVGTLSNSGSSAVINGSLKLGGVTYDINGTR